MSDLLTNANLVLATMDLKMVQSIIGAMRAADRGAAAALGTTPQFRHRDVFTPTPRFEPRVVYHPTPRFEPRRVFHPTPRFECPPPCPAPTCPEPARTGDSADKPIWMSLPPIPPPAPAPQIKVTVVRPDIRHKGSLIDTFI